jgi:RecB family endonuclease NucS
MPLEIGLWRVDDKPTKLATSSIRLEARLEELIESDVSILGEPLLLVGRQVSTSYGKVIDLLGVDADGVLHVLELKRDRTHARSSPRSSTTAHG